MKILVIYKSKTGFAKRYAQWIAEELNANMIEYSHVTTDMFKEYDAVIYGGGVYAVGINGVKLITKNFDKLAGKKVAVFATGTAPSREDTINKLRDKNFTPEQQSRIQFFYLRGGFDYNRIKSSDKIAMTILKWIVKRKKELTPDEKDMLSAYDNPVDFTDKENIREVVSYVNSFKNDFLPV